ncbi:response regulator transcription factor [Pseudogemmobacter faecipullorum]|uniref:Response regulator n=1 Tax=Pseudogemmobacter faecipullorum TaxID=2755041 RepID=A0ABS8CK13_9RHOB|nr:response regulator [Pseudogemmobacter faecipullorum]MCB5409731.1 response regulator [Pseudogemmobacter faecipullorum]
MTTATGETGRPLLLIEDEPNIAEAICFILGRAGWQVTHLSSGDGAVAAARRLGPELVILDHMLPGLSGLDVLASLRADPHLGDVPVLMLTAKGQPRDREAAEKAGATRFMTKPFSNAEIVELVRTLARAGAAADAGGPTAA